MSTPEFEVGQPVQVTGPNPHNRWRGTVVKVGRSLLHVQPDRSSHIRPKVFRLTTRIEAGSGYGHERVLTLPEWEEIGRRRDAEQRLRGLGFRTIPEGLSIDTLAAVADTVENPDVLARIGAPGWLEHVIENVPLSHGSLPESESHPIAEAVRTALVQGDPRADAALRGDA